MNCENCRHLTVVGLLDTGPWAALAIPDQLVPCCFSSASVSDRQLLRGWPLFLFPCGFQVRAWRVVLDAGFLRVSPIQPHFLRSICLATLFLSRSLPQIFISDLRQLLRYKLSAVPLITLNYTSHIKLSTVYMYPHISSWRHSDKRADSNQARAYKAKRRGINLTRETALAREKRIFQACCKTGTVTTTLHFLSRAVTRSPRPSCTLPVDTGSLTHCCLRFHHWLPHNNNNKKKKNYAF